MTSSNASWKQDFSPYSYYRKSRTLISIIVLWPLRKKKKNILYQNMIFDTGRRNITHIHRKYVIWNAFCKKLKDVLTLDKHKKESLAKGIYRDQDMKSNLFHAPLL